MRTKDPDTFTQLKESEKDLKSNIRKDKNQYYIDKLEGARNNSKKIWEIINEITNRKSKTSYDLPTLYKEERLLSDPKEVTEAFNDYYVNTATNIAKKIQAPKNNFEFYLQMTPSPTIELEIFQVTRIDILKIAATFKNKNSSGHDRISTKLLKQLLPHVVHKASASHRMMGNKRWTSWRIGQRPSGETETQVASGSWRPAPLLTKAGSICLLLN